MIDRKTKLLLAAIAAALWVIALRPLLGTRPAEAQAPRVEYSIVEVGRGGTLGVTEAQSKANHFAKDGWRAKALAVTDEATLVLMEKTK
jgi:hypothetical protein